MDRLQFLLLSLFLLASCTLRGHRSRFQDDAGIAGAEKGDASGGNGDRRGTGGAGGETGEGGTGAGGASDED